ncbi:hypothetical protein AMS68_003768 [Peltaster fructicola]|uniref:MARVEL domain-containing protein n=1 Tax=Peltaster fructicola TaxID=286661 RepID=A0A6H0XUA6_9PEZI|nr:hypothetical protein AMS68_003768 [Peltaster fructicola]
MFGRKKMATGEKDLVLDSRASPAQVRRATRTRMSWALITSFLLLISVIFLILVEIGDISASRSALTNIYFIKIDLTNIVPIAVPNAELINSIARTLGLHDFYTVGLWNFCEGYNSDGVTGCSTPQALYWFNPVEIIGNELLAGAEISLPQELVDILGLIHTVSNWMFGLFLTSACLSFVMIFIVPLSVFSRWATFPIAVLTFLTALFVTVAAVIATVLFVIMSNVFNNATQLNIGAEIGKEMFAFMWIAAATAIFAWLIQMGQLCCCASRRDVRTGRKQGALSKVEIAREKPRRRPWFGRRRA